MDALLAGQAIEKIFLQRQATGDDIAQIKKIARERNVPVSQVPPEKLMGLTRESHQGVVAIAGVIHYQELQDVISFVVEKGDCPLFVLSDGLTDIRNIGAIARTALALDAHGLILPVSSSPALSEGAVKTSAGALRKLALCRIPSVQQAIDVLRMNGIQIVGAEMRGSVPLYEANLTLPTCIVMGSEETGVSKDVLKRADALVHIPMPGGFESLNVSVAAGLMLYEAMRQRLILNKLA